MNMKQWGGAWLAIALAIVSTCACGENTTYYVTNAQGTVVATMDSQSNVTYTATYRPYGKQQIGTPQAGPGYTGHVNDPDTGLVYMQARYYDPGVGRFLSRDPSRFKPNDLFKFSRYDYANNNPIIGIDPNGKDTVVIVGGAAPPTEHDSVGNPVGHIAIAFTGRGVYSYGTKEKFGSSTTKYLASQGTYRSSHAIILKTTPVQEAKMAHFLQKNYGSKNSPKYSVLSHDCATAVTGALSSAGIGNTYIGIVSMTGAILPPQLPSTPEAMAKSFPDSKVIDLPKGGPIPKLFKSFDPTNER